MYELKTKFWLIKIPFSKKGTMLFKWSHSNLHEICHSPDGDEVEIEFSDMRSSQAAVSPFQTNVSTI